MIPMGRREVRLVIVAVLAALAAGGCGGRQAATPPAQAVPVDVTEVGYSDVRPVLSYSGTVSASRKALLAAQIQGRIERFHVDVGDRVKEGDLLVELGGEQLAQARAQYEAAEKEWSRVSALLDKRAVTQQAYDQTKAAYESAKASFQLVQGSAEIRAPFDGVVTERLLDAGEVFVLMPGAAGAPAILELARIDSVKVELELSERDFMRAEKGLSATVAVEAHPGETFHGEVSRVDPAVDPASRTATVEIVVANRSEKLRPGMFADVALELSKRRALLVTRNALVRQEGTGSFYVYVVEDGKARRRNLELGSSFGENVEVVSGLKAGDRVVTAGRYRLNDGSPVTVTGAAADTTGSKEAAR
jgi:membrane fusion protein (multidrug efflux system)